MTAVDHGGLAVDPLRAPPSAAARVRPGRVAGTRLSVIMLAGVGLFTLVEFALILVRLGGHFSYSLDDPYIHLALADQIAQGHYGLNPGEAAAPASSILFPFLLAGLSFTGIGQYAPLAICFAATMVSGLLLSSILELSISTERLPVPALAALVACLLLSLNLIGLEFAGLEHSLHVAVTLACVLGMVRFLKTGEVAPWWWLCALAQPLIRYEGASIWLATACLLLYHRRFRPGLTLLVAGLLALGLFSAFLHALGLPLLPSYVLVKYGVAVAGTQFSLGAMLDGLRDAITENARTYGGSRLLVLCGLLAVLISWKQGVRGERRRIAVELATVALFVSEAHLVCGRFGGFARYEIYVVALDFMILLYGFGPLADRWLRPANLPRFAVFFAAPIAFWSMYAYISAVSFQGARNIYDQQYQMHRFATEFYKKPVGVNDLGWATYHSPSYVLDFWGLGSEQARLARAKDPYGGPWMDDLARQHDIGLAMIYDSWFDRLPEGWSPVARLKFDAPRITAADSVVTL